MQNFQITVDGISRVGALRVDGAGPIEHIALWFHGATSSGPTILSHVPVFPGFLHVCATGLVATNGKNTWVPPGLPTTDPFYTPTAPDDRHDCRLVEALAQRYLGLHPTAKLWVGGNSKGGELVHGVHAWADELGLATFRQAKGLYVSRAGVPYLTGDPPPTVNYGWGMAERVAAGKVTPRSLMFLHGGDHLDETDTMDTTSQVYAGGDTWEHSADALADSVGVTLGNWGPATPPTCCTYDLVRRAGTKPGLAMVELWAKNAPHATIACPTCNEYGKAMAWWTAVVAGL